MGINKFEEHSNIDFINKIDDCIAYFDIAPEIEIVYCDKYLNGWGQQQSAESKIKVAFSELLLTIKKYEEKKLSFLNKCKSYGFHISVSALDEHISYGDEDYIFPINICVLDSYNFSLMDKEFWGQTDMGDREYIILDSF